MHKILFMGSFARSGETLLQRCLSTHPNIHIVTQLNEPDRMEDINLFNFLRNYPGKTIEHTHPLIQKASISEGKLLLLKYAVWNHAHPFDGFLLARNPFSIIKSLLHYSKVHEETLEQSKARLIRWANGIDPAVIPDIMEQSYITGIALLYARKMLPLVNSNLPVIRYEDFTQHPEMSLKKLFLQIGLPWSDTVLESHKNYAEGQYGHGGIELWKPIHSDSRPALDGFSLSDIKNIQEITHPILEKLNYQNL